MQNSYDEVIYDGHCHPRTHPDHLRVMAALHGLEAPDPSRSRVLEIGCAIGANLLPMAERLPGARLVGVDSARAQIARAEELRREAGGADVSFEHKDLRSIDRASGEFDYIIAHGVHSWVEPDVQAGLIAAIASVLSPSGVAYVSHNVYPGFYFRRMAREAMLRHAPLSLPPATRLRASRAMLERAARCAGSISAVYQAAMSEELALLSRMPDWAALHDVLHESFSAVYFEDFARDLRAQGLDFLCDAHPTLMDLASLDPELQAFLQAAGVLSSPAAREQYLDHITGRTFRETIVCRAGRAGARPLPAALVNLHLISACVPEATSAAFVHPSGLRIEGLDPLTSAILARLAEGAPGSVSFGELARDVSARLTSAGPEAIADHAFELVCRGVIEPVGRPLRIPEAPPERLRASTITRCFAAKFGWAPSPRHEPIPLTDMERRILALVRGEPTERPAIVRAWTAAGGDAPAVEKALARLTTLGLLEAA